VGALWGLQRLENVTKAIQERRGYADLPIGLFRCIFQARDPEKLEQEVVSVSLGVPLRVLGRKWREVLGENLNRDLTLCPFANVGL